MDQPAGVIFDMDGVLVDSAKPHFESWQLLSREQGSTVTQVQFEATFGRPNQAIIPILFGEVSDSQMVALADRKEEIYRELIKSDPPLVPGAAKLIQSLHHHGLRLAVGSSGPIENIKLILSSLGIESLISAIVSGGDVSKGKPDPQVFQLASERLRLDSGRCVVVEDALVGIQAARAAGCKSIAILIYHNQDVFPEADLTVATLADLEPSTFLDLIDQPNQGLNS